jgi:hypothetical protein
MARKYPRIRLEARLAHARIPASASTVALGAPAALAGLAYLNARWRVSVDLELISSLAASQRALAKREAADRTNSFYLIEEHAQNPKVADKIFIIYQGKKWTFKQSYTMVLRYAGYLHSTHSIAPGEIVAIDFMNSPQFLFLAMAIWSLGALPAFINYNLAGNPFVHSVKTSSARVSDLYPQDMYREEPSLLYWARHRSAKLLPPLRQI